MVEEVVLGLVPEDRSTIGNAALKVALANAGHDLDQMSNAIHQNERILGEAQTTKQGLLHDLLTGTIHVPGAAA